MKHLGSLLAITVGFGMLVGTVTSGCGGDTASITTGGTNATSGSGGGASSSSSGMGGSGGCSSAADCSDGFSCTIDTCNAGACQHVVGPNSGETSCPSGQICNLTQGCVELVICADDAICLEKLGADPCKANIHCDQAMSVCSYTSLDKDNDGEAPIVCGGQDCDDSNGNVHPGAAEVCDGKDNNCNGATDETATCPGMATCEAGACTCPPENTCGTDCVDTMNDNMHCGSCNVACLGVASCTGGQCVCPTNSTVCNNICVDTTNDPANCGGCAKTCASGYSCVNSLCTCLGTPCGTACIDTMNDPMNCGGCNMACPVNTQCTNGICACPTGQTYCLGQCVDTRTNTTHCGGCNKPCNGVCSNGMCSGCTAANLYLFADISGSMGDMAGAGGTKLEAMRAGINSFLSNSQSANMGVGIGYHPVAGVATGNVCYGTNTPCTKNEDCPILMICGPGTGTTDSCVEMDYQTPGVGIALLPGNQTAITNSMAGKTAAGGSVPPPGYRGALQYAKNYAISHSTEKVGVVLLLDSMPNICNMVADMPDDLLPIAQQFANGSPRVVTYVIGMGTNVTTTQLNQIATAGGTNTGYLTNTPTEITSALNSIRSQFKTCP